MYEHTKSQRSPDGGALLAPRAFNTANPLLNGDWANGSSFRMDRSAGKKHAYRANAVITNELFGAWITYQRKLLRNRLDWRIQLNVRNLFDAYTVFPMRTVDARDGTHRGAKAIYRLSEPRTYTLTSTFTF